MRTGRFPVEYTNTGLNQCFSQYALAPSVMRCREQALAVD
jgi:hypothetical protein